MRKRVVVCTAACFWECSPPFDHVQSSHVSPRVLAAGLVSAAGWALYAEQALAAKQVPCTPIEACCLVHC